MNLLRFDSKVFGLTEFAQQNEPVFRCLFGMQMHIPQADAPARLKDLLTYDIQLSGTPITFRHYTASRNDDTLTVICKSAMGIDCELQYIFDEPAGIIRQTLTLINNSALSAEVRRLQPLFVFASAEFERFVQSSGWCYEGDGGWAPLQAGGLLLGGENGRTTQGNTPLLALRCSGSGRGIAFHILPTGNWEARLTSSSASVGPQGAGVLRLSMGHASERLACVVEPGQRLEMPEIWIQALPDGLLHNAAPRLHRYLLDHNLKPKGIAYPVVYNTWMDCFDDLNPTRLMERLLIAKELGCEVFCVDAGWFGQAEDWSESVGDWRERTGGVLGGKLREFSDEVRRDGLDFGLWMEPERVTSISPVYLAHPDWFAAGNKGFYPMLWLPEVYAYIKSEVLRVIDAYDVKWLKLDFNQELEEDPRLTGLMLYYRQFYRMMDELKQALPDVIFENCASGGLRNDINTMSAFDVSFLSDNANPWDGLITFEQISLRALHSRVYRWLALQKGPDIPAYDRSKSTVEHTLVTPASPGSGFADCEVIRADFACKLLCSTPMGLTGDIATLDQETRTCIRDHISFFKTWRSFLSRTVLQLDAEPVRLGDRRNWHIHQYMDEKLEKCLIYAYRFNHIGEEKWVRIYGVSERYSYRVKVFGEETSIDRTGEDLRRHGITIRLKQRNSGAIVIIEQI